MPLFKLPEDFKPESLIYKYSNKDSNEFLQKLEIRTRIETRRLNKLGAQISDYLSLIKSAGLQLSDFEALSLAIELHKAENLKEIEVSGNIGADVSGSLGIDDSIYVRGGIDTNVSGNINADVSGSLGIDDGVYVRGDITTS
jgi:hypothetical protein